MVTLDTVYTTQRYVCISTDTKPTTDVNNGSLMLEMDTGKVYVFDQDNTTWVEVSLPW